MPWYLASSEAGIELTDDHQVYRVSPTALREFASALAPTELTMLLPTLAGWNPSTQLSVPELRAIHDQARENQFDLAVAKFGNPEIAFATVAYPLISPDLDSEGRSAAELKHLGVHPDVRGKGKGREMLNEVVSWCRQRGITHLYTSPVPGQFLGSGNWELGFLPSFTPSTEKANAQRTLNILYRCFDEVEDPQGLLNAGISATRVFDLSKPCS